MRLMMLFLAGLAIAACERQGEPAAEQPVEQPTETAGPVKGTDRSRAGQPAPAAEMTDSEGETTSLAAVASGEPILVNLWATWCAPCVKELPTLQALDERPSAPRVIAVSQDMAPRGSVDAFLERHQLGQLEVWHDPDMALSGGLGAQVLPTTILYDARGREIWRYVGDLDWTGDEAARLLAEAQAPAAG